ncbi:MAG: 2-dehydro-3-deoxygalactonokinase [Limisphaerales bacterium]
MARDRQFLSCDWGTTSFRLRWVTGPDATVVREARNAEGVRAVHGRLEADSAPAVRNAAFERVLADGIRQLSESGGPVPPGIPVVISGMASSSVGWRELPFAPTPCALDGSGLRVESMGRVEVDGAAFPVWMVSGLSTGRDMMRGEETELLGVASLPEVAAVTSGCLVILPGTHSKHVRVEGGLIVDARTHMTGEVLEALANHTLLRVSVTWPLPVLDEGLDSEARRKALEEGVIAARDYGWAGALFQVRVRTVLGGVGTDANAWFLAGLMLGTEAVDLLRWDRRLPIVLAGGAPFSAAYRAVFETLELSDRLTVIPPSRLAHATVRAHALLLERIDPTHERSTI